MGSRKLPSGRNGLKNYMGREGETDLKKTQMWVGAAVEKEGGALKIGHRFNPGSACEDWRGEKKP